jgi:outer membrane protein assembly factor BamB
MSAMHDGGHVKTVRWVAAAAAATALATGTAVPARAATVDWAQAGFAATNTAYNPAEAVINASTIGRLRPGWAVTPAAGSEGCTGQRPPVVAGGRAFVTEGDGVGAYDAATGRRLWRDTTAFDGYFSPALAAAGGLVVAAAYDCHSNSDPSTLLVAFDARTGTRRWVGWSDTPSETVVADSGMLVISGESPSDQPTVSAYRVADGRLVWSYPGTDLAAPVVAGGRVLLTNVDSGASYGISVTTGRIAWKRTATYHVSAANPAGDRFYATTPAGALVALTVATGARAWSVTGGWGTVTTDGRRLYVSRGSWIATYDAANGRRLWLRDIGGHLGRLVRAGGLLYAVVDGAPMAVLSPVTGAAVASGRPWRGARSHPVLVGGRLFVTDGTTLRTYTP